MKHSSIAIILLFCLMFSCKQDRPRILVFSKTKGYRHESISTGKVKLIELGAKHDFDVDTTEDASAFTDENLKKYSAVIFLNTTQDVLNLQQQGYFKRFIQAGGGFVGIHAAADTEYEWPWYGRLVGAYFKSHPQIQEATVKKVRPFGPNTLPDNWKRKDEWYNYRNISDSIHVIYNLDETSYQGGQNGENHPIAWYHEFDGGRAFYTGMGHTHESYSDSLYMQHVLDGIQYAIGENKLDYSKATAKVAPEDNRFTKTVLDFNLNEPTEMVVLSDKRIIFVERKGDVKLYDPKDGKVKVINTLNIGTKFEDGVMGIATDPAFDQNHWLYIYYAHPEKSANILSRFTFTDDKIDVGSEKVMIEVPTQRESCCHTGGSLAFDAKGNLFLSTGDNTNPWESKGYSPSDERPGRGPYDAQKSSSNTNDLRGKILRIHPEPDGSYTIPEGNLFAKGEPQTRPEIYVMGCRNPYRISVDQRTGNLFWGEVGPDAGEPDSLRGPRSYDEVNMATKAGNFGWPYFVGKNFAYSKYDYETGKVGAWWDPAKPINESVNNTGKRELPPAQPALIYYPYAKSEEFPMLKEGGRNAMAGPVYYSDQYKDIPTAFPDYFDGKLIAYDWMRNWIFLVSLDKTGAIADMEPFMADTQFNNIIDMAFGPDGKLYMIEYGTKWFAQNLDARLVRIDYNGGNRTPVAKLTADKTSGAAPLTVVFSNKGSMDYDTDDSLAYVLEVGGKTYTSHDTAFTVTLDKPGVYNAKLKVTDDKGNSSTASTQVLVGNEPPVIEAHIADGNKTFYFPETKVKYSVKVTDKEDGSSADGTIREEAVTVLFDYLKGFDMAKVAQGHQMPTVELPGKALIGKSDCKSCHIIDQRSAGPSYKEVAAKYKTQTDAIDRLAAKIIKGGAGIWGDTEMAAHPQVSVEEAKEMVRYILSLGDEKAAKKLPLNGVATTGKENQGAYLLTASYHDKGANNIPSIGSTATLVLRSPMLKADQATDLHIVRVLNWEGNIAFENVKHTAHAAFKNLDLTGVKKAKVYPFLADDQAGGTVEIHLDKPDGKLLGKASASGKGLQIQTINLEPATGYHDLYLVFKNEGARDKSLFYFGGIELLNK
ncbi:MAG TPA: ThuA domain-containing protein [Ohtaekwangia sp.]